MKAVIVDLELNQPSNSVIQIGAITVDLRSCRVLSRFDQFCALPEGEVLSEFITELTGITGPQVDSNSTPHYKFGLTQFWKYVADSQCRVVSAWGTDVDQLIRDADQLGIERPRRIRRLDIKSMFSVLKCGLPSSRVRGGLRETLETLGLEFTGRQHNALTDSLNTAKLLIYARELQYLHSHIQGLKFKQLEIGETNANT